jgi:hypothetical protein
MSYIVTIQTKVHDPAAVQTACKRLDLPEEVGGTASLYSGEATGLLVGLPGWQYPVVIDVLTGTPRYGNFEGRWVEQAQFDRLLQMYAVEKAKLEARKRGYAVTEQILQDGAIQLRIIEAA